jgi:hypothetical protein
MSFHRHQQEDGVWLQDIWNLIAAMREGRNCCEKERKKESGRWKKKKTKVAPTHEFSSSSDRMQENLDKRNVGSAKRLIPAAL